MDEEDHEEEVPVKAEPVKKKRVMTDKHGGFATREVKP
jgi:hypothetical protein